MKAIKTIIMSMLLLVGLATSCTNDIDETASQSEAYLKIDATVNSITRGAIDATNFTKGDAIGVFVRDLEGKDYNAATNCSNIKATYDGSKWTLASKVPLTSGKEAVVYAYYPYNANAVVNGDSIDIDITKQEDVMYGNATGVTVNNSTAKITFNHALARVTFAITKGVNDVGTGYLNNVRIGNILTPLLLGQAYIIATKGRMDVKTGTFKTNRTKEDEIILDKDLPLSQTETNVDCLLIPYHKNMTYQTNQIIVVKALPYVNLYLTIDGKEYKQIISDPQWYAGQQYVYPITVNRKKEYIKAKVGDYYYSDGSFSTVRDNSKKCIGVVFALTNEKGGEINRYISESEHGRIISLTDISSKRYLWSNNNSVVKGIPVYDTWGSVSGIWPTLNIWGMPDNWPTYGVYSDFDGPDHQKYISTETYPAANACYTYKTEGTNAGDWYLPSFGELKLVQMQKGINKIDISDPHWTSTQAHYEYGSLPTSRAATVGGESLYVKTTNYFHVRAAKEF